MNICTTIKVNPSENRSTFLLNNNQVDSGIKLPLVQFGPEKSATSISVFQEDPIEL